MLRTNLSTRPFYNERAVHAALGIVAMGVILVTVFNVTRVIALSTRHTELTLQARRDVEAAQEVGDRADAIQRELDGAAVQGVAAAVREANTLIDRRTFSWTRFFNQIETTLPPSVMLISVVPEIEQGVVLVTMVVIGRRVDDIDQFMEQLESTGAFADVLARQEEATDEGMYRAALRGRYLGAAPAWPAVVSASGPGDPP